VECAEVWEALASLLPLQLVGAILTSVSVSFGNHPWQCDDDSAGLMLPMVGMRSGTFSPDLTTLTRLINDDSNDIVLPTAVRSKISVSRATRMQRQSYTALDNAGFHVGENPFVPMSPTSR
jgi:hypothetical protein